MSKASFNAETSHSKLNISKLPEVTRFLNYQKAYADEAANNMAELSDSNPAPNTSVPQVYPAGHPKEGQPVSMPMMDSAGGMQPSRTATALKTASVKRARFGKATMTQAALMRAKMQPPRNIKQTN